MEFDVMLWYLLIVSSDFTVIIIMNAEYKIISPYSPLLLLCVDIRGMQ